MKKSVKKKLFALAGAKNLNIIFYKSREGMGFNPDGTHGRVLPKKTIQPAPDNCSRSQKHPQPSEPCFYTLLLNNIPHRFERTEL